MKKKSVLLLSICIVLAIISGCGKKKPAPAMVDIETIRNDGSHDEKYIFRDELEREKKQKRILKKEKF